MVVQSDIITTPHHRLHRFHAVPEGPPIARVILLHGYGDHAGKHLHVLSWLADHRIAASVTDFRGHGRSTGRVAHVKRWEEYLEDLKAMLAGDAETEDRGSKIEDRKDKTTLSFDPLSFLNPRPIPTFLIAHSHGGLIAIIAALRGLLDKITGVILIAPYLELKIAIPWSKRIAVELTSRIFPAFPFKSGIGGPMLTHDGDFIEVNKTDPYCPGIATPRWFTTTRKMQAEARVSAAKFKLPLLMLVPGEDVIADPKASVSFFENAGSSDKHLRQYPDLRHELLRETGREKIFQVILDWIVSRAEQAASP